MLVYQYSRTIKEYVETLLVSSLGVLDQMLVLLMIQTLFDLTVFVASRASVKVCSHESTCIHYRRQHYHRRTIALEVWARPSYRRDLVS